MIERELIKEIISKQKENEFKEENTSLSKTNLINSIVMFLEDIEEEIIEIINEIMINYGNYLNEIIKADSLDFDNKNIIGISNTINFLLCLKETIIYLYNEHIVIEIEDFLNDFSDSKGNFLSFKEEYGVISDELKGDILNEIMPLVEGLGDDLLEMNRQAINCIDLEYINNILKDKKYENSTIKIEIRRFKEPISLCVLDSIPIKLKKSFKIFEYTIEEIKLPYKNVCVRFENNKIYFRIDNANFNELYLKNYSWKQLNKLANKLGFFQIRCKGSHATFTDGYTSITIPQSKTLGKGLEKTILKKLLFTMYNIENNYTI